MKTVARVEESSTSRLGQWSGAYVTSNSTICPVCGAAAVPKEKPDGLGSHLTWALPERPPPRVLKAMADYLALHRRSPCPHELWRIMREQLAKPEPERQAIEFGAPPPQGHSF